jgi:hypothetical protein
MYPPKSDARAKESAEVDVFGKAAVRYCTVTFDGGITPVGRAASTDIALSGEALGHMSQNEKLACNDA